MSLIPAPIWRAYLCRLVFHVLKSLYLAQEFIGIPAYIEEIDLGADELSVRIDDESPPEGESALFLIYAEEVAYFAFLVRSHMIFNILKQLLLMEPT